MAQPDFIKPDFLEDCSVDEIHARMMNNLPADIDSTPGGFAYDFTRPTAVEKSEMLDFYMVRVLMAMFPQYAWEEMLDLHGQQVNLKRHQATAATGTLKITGEPGTEIEAGTIFSTPSTTSADSIEFETDEDCTIGLDGTVTVPVTASEEGSDGNVGANTVTLADDPMNEITAVTNESAMTGGTDEESDDDFYDRIAAEYANSNTFLGNDNDYVRWAKEAGAGGCVVDPAWNGPGTVRLVLVDTNGQPASAALCTAVYNYIVSPNDRTQRLLPTACAQLTCTAATTRAITFECTGLVFENTTDIDQIKAAFTTAVREVFEKAKEDELLRYNDVRPLISAINGVTDFDTFTMDGDTENIQLDADEYPEVGTLTFTAAT